MMRAIAMVSSGSHNSQASRAASVALTSAAPLPYPRSMIVMILIVQQSRQIASLTHCHPAASLGSFLPTMKESRNMMLAAMASTINTSI
jgi:hypothetical protein